MDAIVWLPAGAVGGWLAGLVLGGRGEGLLGHAVVGVIGAMLGGFLARHVLGFEDAGLLGLPVACAGAVGFLLILGSLPGERPLGQ